eukprot:8408157-Alexandrium_andersonii.AAC.1
MPEALLLDSSATIGGPFAVVKEHAVNYRKSARSIGAVATRMEVGAISKSGNKFCNFCQKKGRLESECRRRGAKTPGGASDSKPSNPTRDKTCTCCHKKGHL